MAGHIGTPVVKVRDLIKHLRHCDPEAEVLIEQTNDDGPEFVSAVVQRADGPIVLEGDLFK